MCWGAKLPRLTGAAGYRETVLETLILDGFILEFCLWVTIASKFAVRAGFCRYIQMVAYNNEHTYWYVLKRVEESKDQANSPTFGHKIFEIIN